jgi:hypothetical protein
MYATGTVYEIQHCIIGVPEKSNQHNREENYQRNNS